MELWDAYLADGTPAGRDLVRGEPIPEGLRHLVSEVLVRHVDGDFLLMQRAFTKPSYPGLYEATAGGSALKGETALAAAKRELWEETGLSVKRLTPLYRVVSRDTIYCGYFGRIACDKSAVALQGGETVGYLWLPKDDFLNFLQSEQYVPTHRERLRPELNRILMKRG